MDNLNSTGRENPLAKRMMSRYDADKKIWDEWSGTWQECYDYALPHREQFFGSTRKRATDIYDETAIVALQEFGSKISTTMMPPFMRWSDLKVGRGIPEEQREQLNLELEQVNKFLFEQINESNFYSEVPVPLVLALPPIPPSSMPPTAGPPDMPVIDWIALVAIMPLPTILPKPRAVVKALIGLNDPPNGTSSIGMSIGTPIVLVS